MLLYIIGTAMIIFSLPLVFLPPLTNFTLILIFSCLYKIGSGLAIISQLTIIPKITSNRNRRVIKVLSRENWLKKLRNWA